jgi:hypothetical protein
MPTPGPSALIQIKAHRSFGDRCARSEKSQPCA